MAPPSSFIIQLQRVLSCVNKVSIMEKQFIIKRIMNLFVTVLPKREILSKIQFKIDFSSSLSLAHSNRFCINSNLIWLNLLKIDLSTGFVMAPSYGQSVCIKLCVPIAAPYLLKT